MGPSYSKIINASSVKKIYLIISTVFFIISCNHHYYNATNKDVRNYIFYGKINGMDSGRLYLVHIDTSGNLFMPALDSANVTNSYFQFQGYIIKPEPCKIMFKNEEHLWPYTAYFILDTGITKGELFKDSMANSVITGGKQQQQFSVYNKKLFDLEVSYEKKALLYKKELKNTDSLDERFYYNKYNLILNEARANPESFVSTYLIKRNLTEEMTITDLENLYNSLANTSNYYTNDLLKLINAKKRTSLGRHAPEFKIIDNTNRTLTNETFKGKYLLLDFWASWCPPCREENHNLLKAYNKYANKGFEIISISLDQNKTDWEDAVKQDNLTWIQACDLKGARSKMDEDFGFLTIPTNFLIDKEGKIIDKNLTGMRLEEVLSKIFETN